MRIANRTAERGQRLLHPEVEKLLSVLRSPAAFTGSLKHCRAARGSPPGRQLTEVKGDVIAEHLGQKIAACRKRLLKRLELRAVRPGENRLIDRTERCNHAIMPGTNHIE